MVPLDQTWVFPDDQREKSSISKFLANAHKWRQTQATTTETEAEPHGEPEVKATETEMDDDEEDASDDD